MSKDSDLMTKIRIALIFAAVAGFFVYAYAASGSRRPETGHDIAVKGVVKGIPACASCHGANGAGRLSVGIPRLAGLSSFYIDSQLRYFADGKRANDIMSPYAKMLTPTERNAVADFFAAKTIDEFPARARFKLAPARSAEFAEGREIAENGIWQRAMPACGLCHGATGAGVGAEFPALAGQSRGYLIGQLDAWKANRRRTPLGKFMRAEALHMDQADIKAVATYYALLPQAHQHVGDKK